MNGRTWFSHLVHEKKRSELEFICFELFARVPSPVCIPSLSFSLRVVTSVGFTTATEVGRS